MDKNLHNQVAFMLVALLGTISGCDGSGSETSKVNGSVHILAGSSPGVAETVNGGVEIDANATVTVAKTVNGGIHLGAHSSADSVSTVNGSATLDAGSRVTGGVESVNGGITLRDGADITGSIENVNGNIQLSAAHVAGGIKTVNGNIDIHGDSHVEHGILVQKPTSDFFHVGSETPRIVIGPGSKVEGELRFERQVQLYVSDRATVGPVVGATAIPFTGDAPTG